MADSKWGVDLLPLIVPTLVFDTALALPIVLDSKGTTSGCLPQSCLVVCEHYGVILP